MLFSKFKRGGRCEWSPKVQLEAVECNSIMNHRISIHLILYMCVITEVITNCALNCSDPVIESNNTSSNQRQWNCVVDLWTKR